MNVAQRLLLGSCYRNPFYAIKRGFMTMEEWEAAQADAREGRPVVPIVARREFAALPAVQRARELGEAWRDAWTELHQHGYQDRAVLQGEEAETFDRWHEAASGRRSPRGLRAAAFTRYIVEAGEAGCTAAEMLAHTEFTDKRAGGWLQEQVEANRLVRWRSLERTASGRLRAVWRYRLASYGQPEDRVEYRALPEWPAPVPAPVLEGTRVERTAAVYDHLLALLPGAPVWTMRALARTSGVPRGLHLNGAVNALLLAGFLCAESGRPYGLPPRNLVYVPTALVPGFEPADPAPLPVPPPPPAAVAATEADRSKHAATHDALTALLREAGPHGLGKWELVKRARGTASRAAVDVWLRAAVERGDVHAGPGKTPVYVLAEFLAPPTLAPRAFKTLPAPAAAVEAPVLSGSRVERMRAACRHLTAVATLAPVWTYRSLAAASGLGAGPFVMRAVVALVEQGVLLERAGAEYGLRCKVLSPAPVAFELAGSAVRKNAELEAQLREVHDEVPLLAHRVVADRDDQAVATREQVGHDEQLGALLDEVHGPVPLGRLGRRGGEVAHGVRHHAGSHGRLEDAV